MKLNKLKKLQGRGRFPIGGKSPRARKRWFSAILKPTVKVWMVEVLFLFSFLTKWRHFLLWLRLQQKAIKEQTKKSWSIKSKIFLIYFNILHDL